MHQGSAKSRRNALKHYAFTLDGGAVKQAKWLVAGSNFGWLIMVAPDSEDNVAATLPATTDCAETSASAEPMRPTRRTRASSGTATTR
ncbi:MAG: hypothetical protein F4066_07360 [Chloroflexi bacterium]|nr:hypothetical protein [Chloroflexota bacterium]MYI04664.1 hypothetical protein [Chloroflexota bacterium]